MLHHLFAALPVARFAALPVARFVALSVARYADATSGERDFVVPRFAPVFSVNLP